jgi:hypothetical protein
LPVDFRRQQIRAVFGCYSKTEVKKTMKAVMARAFLAMTKLQPQRFDAAKPRKG